MPPQGLLLLSATSRPEQMQQAPLLDCLVCAGEQLRRHLDAEQPGRLQVDDEFEFGGLQDWQVGRLLAFENLSMANS
jgi:hypothetical protein